MLPTQALVPRHPRSMTAWQFSSFPRRPAVARASRGNGARPMESSSALHPVMERHEGRGVGEHYPAPFGYYTDYLRTYRIISKLNKVYYVYY